MAKYYTEIKWGLIFAASTLVWMFFEKAMGWHDELIADHPTYTNLFAIVAFVIFGLALWDKRQNDLGGYMTWKQGFLSGLIVSVVVAILSPLTQWVTSALITPEYFPNAIAYSVEHELMTQTAAEANFNLTSYMIQSTIGALIMGVFTSAIMALILRRRRKAADRIEEIGA